MGDRFYEESWNLYTEVRGNVSSKCQKGLLFLCINHILDQYGYADPNIRILLGITEDDIKKSIKKYATSLTKHGIQHYSNPNLEKMIRSIAYRYNVSDPEPYLNFAKIIQLMDPTLEDSMPLAYCIINMYHYVNSMQVPLIGYEESHEPLYSRLIKLYNK